MAIEAAGYAVRGKRDGVPSYTHCMQCRQHTIYNMLLSVALTVYLIEYRHLKWPTAHLDMMYGTGRLQQEERGRVSSNTRLVRATTYSTQTALLHIKHCCSFLLSKTSKYLWPVISMMYAITYYYREEGLEWVKRKRQYQSQGQRKE